MSRLMDLREVARAGTALEKARADEQAALDRIARAVMAAERPNLQLAAKLTGVPRSTIRRRINTLKENTPS